MNAPFHSRFLTAILLSTMVLPACDSREVVETETKSLVGTWAITGFFDDTGNRSDVISKGFAGAHLEFREDGSGEFTLTPKDLPVRVLATDYTVDEELDFIEMEVTAGLDAPASLELTYIFELAGHRARFHSTNTDILNAIFETDLSGDVMVVASKFGEDVAVE